MKIDLKSLSTLSLLFVLLLSCKNGKDKSDASLMASAETEKPVIKLYTFDGGTVMVNNLEIFAQDDAYKGQSKEFADAFYVVVHPKGTLMWDAGLPEMLVPMKEAFTSEDGNFTVSRKDSVKNQLSKIGMLPSDIDFLSLSHTHFDHSGHAASMKESVWLVQENEFNFVNSEAVKKDYAEQYNAIKELNNIKKIKGDYDVFGDGTVIIKEMPGHTPGHSVLFVDLKEHGPLLLTGDLYHLYGNRKNKRVPIFNYDVKQTLQSMEDFEAFAEKKAAKVYLQHQKEDFDIMPKAPNYLK